jgi:hypothetical protein
MQSDVRLSHLADIDNDSEHVRFSGRKQTSWDARSPPHRTNDVRT